MNQNQHDIEIAIRERPFGMDNRFNKYGDYKLIRLTCYRDGQKNEWDRWELIGHNCSLLIKEEEIDGLLLSMFFQDTEAQFVQLRDIAASPK